MCRAAAPVDRAVRQKTATAADRAREDAKLLWRWLVVSTDLFGDTVPPDGLDCLGGAGEAIAPNVARASYRGLVNKDITV